jgi:hypothetical protein
VPGEGVDAGGGTRGHEPAVVRGNAAEVLVDQYVHGGEAQGQTGKQGSGRLADLGEYFEVLLGQSGTVGAPVGARGLRVGVDRGGAHLPVDGDLAFRNVAHHRAASGFALKRFGYL